MKIQVQVTIHQFQGELIFQLDHECLRTSLIISIEFSWISPLNLIHLHCFSLHNGTETQVVHWLLRILIIPWHFLKFYLQFAITVLSYKYNHHVHISILGWTSWFQTFEILWTIFSLDLWDQLIVHTPLIRVRFPLITPMRSKLYKSLDQSPE